MRKGFRIKRGVGVCYLIYDLFFYLQPCLFLLLAKIELKMRVYCLADSSISFYKNSP